MRFSVVTSTLVVLLASGLFLAGAAAQSSITVQSTGLGMNNLIELDNAGADDISTIRMWLSGGASFTSFKTEGGWSGEKNSVGVLVFTADTPLQAGESVRFAVYTDVEGPSINWKAVDADGNDIASGLERVQGPSAPPTTQTPPPSTVEPTLRSTPSDPGIGSSVRIIGEDFVAGQSLEVFLDGVKLGSSFESGADGSFVITREISRSESAGRATLVISGGQVDLADSAITITDTKRPESRPVQSVAMARLMVNQVPASVEQGDAISISGTGEPGAWVKYDLAGDDGSLLTTGVKNIDSAGSWRLETVIPHQASAGGYSLDATDGRTDLTRNLKIVSVLMIEIEPTRERFSPGQNITFTGTVDANRSVDAILVNSRGAEVMHRTIQADRNGAISFGYTTKSNDPLGTYTLIIMQDSAVATAVVGLGEDPTSRAIVVLDAVSYRSSDTLTALIIGEPGWKVSLAVFDDVNDQPKDIGQGRNQPDPTVNIGPGGTAKYTLSLDRFTGEYEVVVRWGGQGHKDKFVVDPRTPTELTVNVPNKLYTFGEDILVRASTNVAYAAITLKLTDPDGNVVTDLETFTDRHRGSTTLLRIPTGAEEGLWKLVVKGGSQTFTVDIKVVKEVREGLFVEFAECDSGQLVFKGSGAGRGVPGDIAAVATDSDKNKVAASKSIFTKEGVFTIYLPSDNLKTGEDYTLEVDDGQHKASTKFNSSC